MSTSDGEGTKMKSYFAGAIALAVVGALSCGDRQSARAQAPSLSAEHLQVARAGSQPPTKGGPANFTGAVTITPLFRATDRTRATGASVSFEPGARTAWHSHPAGQTLIVTSGTGWVQESGGKKQEIKPGDVVWTPPGVKHWHGATATEAMTHIAIFEHVDGKVVDWMGQVNEEQYRNELKTGSRRDRPPTSLGRSLWLRRRTRWGAGRDAGRVKFTAWWMNW